ncbi:MAG: alpha/beta hydrolase [Nitrospinota bacterium]
MKKITLYFATNRNHEGKDRWRPKSYGRKFSQDGMENLRFGKVTVQADEKKVTKCLNQRARNDKGDGECLAGYLTGQVGSAIIRAYAEKIDANIADVEQPNAKFGSTGLFTDLQKAMRRQSDVLIFIHGFNVSWDEAVGSALALQEMLNRPGVGDKKQKILVVLFTWPSDGKALPFVSYKSDRSEAKGSGYAVGRGILKVRDFLIKLRDRAKHSSNDPKILCGQSLHLLCHSMGNYVLQNALERIQEHTTGSGLSRIFEHIFLCAPDVDEDVLETNKPMGRLHEVCRSVSVYHNRGDVAMYVSDYTKGNPERLGTGGAAHPSQLHHKVQQIDCSPIVTGIVEHSYYLWGPVNTDLRLSMDGVPHEDTRRTRILAGNLRNVWVMT